MTNIENSIEFDEFIMEKMVPIKWGAEKKKLKFMIVVVNLPNPWLFPSGQFDQSFDDVHLGD